MIILHFNNFKLFVLYNKSQNHIILASFNKSVYINFNVKYKPSKVMNKTGRVITIPVLK